VTRRRLRVTRRPAVRSFLRARRNPAAVVAKEFALEHVRSLELILCGAEGEDEDLVALKAARKIRASRRGAQHFLEQIVERAQGFIESDCVVRGR